MSYLHHADWMLVKLCMCMPMGLIGIACLDDDKIHAPSQVLRLKICLILWCPLLECFGVEHLS